MQLEQRQKGLLWYPTRGRFHERIHGRERGRGGAERAPVFPTALGEHATYDRFSFVLDGKPQAVDIDPKEGINEIIELALARAAFPRRLSHPRSLDGVIA
ncbi:MAG: hypothetical protein U1F68_10755 [Gammaproteobacteria bacterium]